MHLFIVMVVSIRAQLTLLLTYLNYYINFVLYHAMYYPRIFLNQISIYIAAKNTGRLRVKIITVLCHVSVKLIIVH